MPAKTIGLAIWKNSSWIIAFCTSISTQLISLCTESCSAVVTFTRPVAGLGGQCARTAGLITQDFRESGLTASFVFSVFPTCCFETAPSQVHLGANISADLAALLASELQDVECNRIVCIVLTRALALALNGRLISPRDISADVAWHGDSVAMASR